MHRLISVRTELKHSVVNKAVDQWRPRLRTHVCDKRQHFEQPLNNEFLRYRFHFSATVTFITCLGVHSIVFFVRRLSNEWCETLKNYFFASCCY